MHFKKSTTLIVLYTANVAVIIYLLFPVFAVLQGALMTEKTLHADISAVIPPEITLSNFLLILTQGESRGETELGIRSTYLPAGVKAFYRAFFNSLIIASSVTLVTLVFGSFSAYTIVRFKFPWTHWILNGSLIARFVPVIVLIIPLFVVGRSLKLTNSLVGVMLAESGFLLPYAILILAPYFASLPPELEDAARVDGCTRFGAFYRIVLPLSAPGMTACGVIMFIVSWHELLIPLVLNSEVDFMTLPMVLSSLVGDTNILFNVMMALAMLALIPTVLMVVLLQKYVVHGLSAGAVKG